jgi:D-alanyl-D-alanine carboxypeptidase
MKSASMWQLPRNILIFLWISQQLTQYAAASGISNDLDRKLKGILDKGVKRHDIHGASAAILYPDGQIWTGTSGYSHDTVSMKPHMLFAIGSVTKNMVAALTLKLTEEGVLDLEDPLSIWLPENPHVNHNITIRQLLNHTSGLYMFWENQDIWDDLIANRSKYFMPEEVLSYIKEPYFEPGDGWRYSNTNYLLAAMVIEKATSSTLAKELQKRFWTPMGIKHVYLSQYDSIPAQTQAHVYGDNYVHGNKEEDLTFYPRVSHESIGFGSSGIFISAADLARWTSSLFQGKIVGEQSLDEMLQFVDFSPVANMRAYGLGVQKYTKTFSSGTEAIGHGGGNIGSTTYMVYLPEQKVRIVVMINAYTTSAAGYIPKRLIRLVLQDRNALGIIPYIPLFPHGFLILSIIIGITFITISIIKRKQQKNGSPGTQG